MAFGHGSRTVQCLLMPTRWITACMEAPKMETIAAIQACPMVITRAAGWSA
jgi:hypothetical protein